ncbi:unnamed protein product [Closterium sp. NIES-54]
MEVARTSMIHAAAPHFLWLFAVRYATHQLNLWPRVSLPETSPTLRWTGQVGVASVFRFYHPASRRVFPSQDVTFDKSIPFYRLFPYRSAPSPPPQLFLTPSPPPVDPLPPQGPVPSGVSQVDPLPCTVPVEVAGDSGAARGTASGDAESGGAEPGGAGYEGAWSKGAEPGGAEPEGVEPGGAESEGAEFGGAEPRGAAGAGASGDTGAGGAGVSARAGGAGGTAAAGPGGARTIGAGAAGTCGVGGAGAGDPMEPGAAGAGGAGAGGAGVGGIGAGGAGAAGAGAVDLGAGGAGGTVRQQPQPPHCLLPLLRLSSPAVLQSVVSLRLVLSRLFALLVAFLVHVLLLSPARTLWHSVLPFVPRRVPLPAPPESSLPKFPDLESDRARGASPNASRLLATNVTDPSFESAAPSALVAELLEFAAACCLDYATALVAESTSASPPSVGGECALGMDVLEDWQEDFECLAAAVPRFASMLLAPEGDPDAPDIPTPRSYAEAITGPYSSQWQAAMDAKMASRKSTGTYDDAVPPSRPNIVDGMWIFKVKRPPGSPPTFKARYIARCFRQRQGVDYF